MRELQFVKHNLSTPICHGYTWTHTAADLLVQIMQKQNIGEIFFQTLTSFSSDRLEKPPHPVLQGCMKRLTRTLHAQAPTCKTKLPSVF